MKKGFLLTKPAPKTASTFSTTQVTHTPALKSPPSDRFHDVIVDFISGLIKRNPETLFGSLLHSDPGAIDDKESPEYTPSRPSGSRTVTFNQNNGKKLKQKETNNTLKNGNVIITGYIPQDQEQAQILDLVVYDILAKWDNYTLLANLRQWGKVISVSTRVHKKYLSVRVRLIPDHKCLKCYNGGDWTVNLEGIPVRWFPASWNLSERKQREKFQTVVYNFPEDMTDASLFPNGRLHQFLLDSGIKSFKIVKEVDGSRKLIGYFDTWDHVSTRINNQDPEIYI
ncbi:hypothetical protein RclHR1_39350001 [Rhizophagus clarus]|uniref:Uncharacterized protein n=1 Tax=Rhizophagus clarus TaxID=94130 RepID=A0A2Z6RFH1_9GLOM|nr:hypothetical protein RclHR1_39350001 [Rhizophagus clarus]